MEYQTEIRIAVALERIATALEAQNKSVGKIDCDHSDQTVNRYGKATCNLCGTCVQHEDCSEPAGHEKCKTCAKGIGGVCSACHCQPRDSDQPEAEPERLTQCQRDLRCVQQNGHEGRYCQDITGVVLPICYHEMVWKGSKGEWCQACGVKVK